MRAKVCVVGAGVVGLTTATQLQQVAPHVEVTLIADKFTAETLSNGAAGVFRPSSNNFRGPNHETASRWLRDSYDYYKEILDSPEAEAAGIKSLAVTVLSTEHEKIVKNAFLEGLLPDYRFMTSEELGQFQGGPYIYGCRFTTMLTDCSKFLPYLMAKFRDRGGKIIKQRVASFNELAPHFDVVVNCCGLVAGDMCGDSTITPIRGQVYKVKAPWITEGFYSDYDTYILPGPEYVTLGGCRQFDSYNTEIDVHDSKSIWERCLRLMPSLRDAQIVREWAGLRPYRPSVRVEAEDLTLEDGVSKLKMVHNYGHGGYGVTSAPGTAVAAVQLVLQSLPVTSKL